MSVSVPEEVRINCSGVSDNSVQSNCSHDPISAVPKSRRLASTLIIDDTEKGSLHINISLKNKYTNHQPDINTNLLSLDIPYKKPPTFRLKRCSSDRLLIVYFRLMSKYSNKFHSFNNYSLKIVSIMYC